MLKIEHLYKSFGSTEVLKDLNLNLEAGTVFGLVGLNGAGKSTLLRTIAGVYQQDAGEVLLNGQDTYVSSAARKEIAFVADEPFFPIGSTLSTVRMMYECMYDFDAAYFEENRKAFELDENKPLSNFSKGMKRRVSLLFALSIHPKLLLLDEAYDGLEPLARLRVKRMIAERMEEEQMAAIISSHNLRELEDICDSYGILENGTLSSYGDLAESKRMVNKYQIAFDTEKKREDFDGLELLSFRNEGRVIQMVIRGEEEDVMNRLNGMKPLLLDVLPVTFEELFLSELESRGHDHE